MSFYEFVLFVHIAASIIWIGSGFLVFVLATRAESARDEASLTKLFMDVGYLANRLFIPASLTVFVAGLVLTIDAWEFDQLWIVLGLVGYAATFVTGAGILGPRSKKVGEAIGAAGGRVSAESLLEMRRVLTIGRFDTIMLFTVVAVMALKPTGDDGVLLAVLAAIIVTGAVWVVSRARAIGAPAGETATATS
jgi:hypothetical protein